MKYENNYISISILILSKKKKYFYIFNNFKTKNMKSIILTGLIVLM